MAHARPIDYAVDARGWPAELEIRFSAADEGTTWHIPEELPEPFLDVMVIDLDWDGRCCGMEMMDADMVTPWRRAQGEALTPRGTLLPANVTTRDAGRIRAWTHAIVCYANSGEPHASWHWHARAGYDYSAELEELRAENVRWLLVGLTPDELIAGVRFINPREHLRGLQPTRGRYAGVADFLRSRYGRG